MNDYFIALDNDIRKYQKWARASVRRAIWCRNVGRDYDSAIQKQGVRFCMEQVTKLRLQRDRVLAANAKIYRAA